MVAAPRLCAYESAARFFQAPGNANDLHSYFEDSIYPVISTTGRYEKVRYPIYITQSKHQGRNCLTMSVPYSSLGFDVLSKIEKAHQVEYLAVNPERLMHIIERQKPIRNPDDLIGGPPRLFLCGARVPLLPTSSQRGTVRSILLTGDDVFSSKFYQQLASGAIDGMQYRCSTSVCRISFWDGTQRSVITKVDKRGNFAFRPGFLGRNQEAFDSFLNYAVDNDLVEFVTSNPIAREISLEP